MKTAEENLTRSETDPLEKSQLCLREHIKTNEWEVSIESLDFACGKQAFILANNGIAADKANLTSGEGRSDSRLKWKNKQTKSS